MLCVRLEEEADEAAWGGGQHLHAEDKQSLRKRAIILKLGLEVRHCLDELVPFALDRILHRDRETDRRKKKEMDRGKNTHHTTREAACARV